MNGLEGRTYERFLELPVVVVVAVLWLVGQCSQVRACW